MDATCHPAERHLCSLVARSGTMATASCVSVIDHRQVLDYTTFGGSVEHEVHRPDLISRRRPPQRLAIRHGHLLSLAATHLFSLPHTAARPACDSPPEASHNAQSFAAALRPDSLSDSDRHDRR